jgi:hypothetical protein
MIRQLLAHSRRRKNSTLRDELDAAREALQAAKRSHSVTLLRHCAEDAKRHAAHQSEANSLEPYRDAVALLFARATGDTPAPILAAYPPAAHALILRLTNLGWAARNNCGRGRRLGRRPPLHRRQPRRTDDRAPRRLRLRRKRRPMAGVGARGSIENASRSPHESALLSIRLGATSAGPTGWTIFCAAAKRGSWRSS